MKCEHVLSALVSGGWLSRRRALRHASRCPRCAGAQAFLQEIEAAFARSDPDAVPDENQLSPRHRDLWMRAATEEAPLLPVPKPARVRFRATWIAAAAAALLATSWAAWLNSPPQPEAPAPPVSANPASKSERTQVAENAGIDFSPARREIAELRRKADLLDVRRDADRLWDRFARRQDLQSF